MQRASIAAWNDEAHVEENRARYAAKRKVFLDLFARARIGSPAAPPAFTCGWPFPAAGRR